MRLSPSSGLSRSQNKLIAKFRTIFTSAHYEDKVCYLLHLSTKRREKKQKNKKEKLFRNQQCYFNGIDNERKRKPNERK